MNDSQWHHYAFTLVNNVLLEGYVDGIKIRSDSGFGVPITNNGSAPVTIGKNDSGTDNYFIGSIDEVRVYNRALSASEVQDLFNSASSTSSGSDAILPFGFLKINNGATYANSASVTLNATAVDNVGVSSYYVSESDVAPQANDSGWTSVTTPVPNYSSNILYTLSGADGAKTIYIWYKDGANNISAMASSAVILNSGGNYYVDSVLGDDGNTGVASSAPWKTISKINNASFPPGSNILFKKGGIWREQLIVPSSGVSGQPITFGAYGEGEKPIFNPSRVVGNWSVYNGNIYSADIDMSVKQVFADGKYYDAAHYPNGGNYLIIDQNSADKTYLTDNDLNLSNEQVAGAEVYMKLVPWHIENKIASGYDQVNHKIQLSGNTGYDIRKDYGYYLSNKLWMLDEPGEWFYDNSAKKLYIWLENNANPNDRVIEVSEYDNGVKIAGKSYVTLQDIIIDKAKLNGINVSNSNNILLQNLTVTNSGQDGISLSNTSGSSLKNNIINNSVRDGAHITGATNVDVLDNAIQNSGNIGVQPKKGYAGVFLADPSNTNINVKNNNIFNNGYIGVFFNGRNIVVQNNFINNSCFILDDCGGIYTNDDQTLSHGGSKILGNIIKDSIGNYAGTIYSASKISQAEGIYLDDRTGNVTVSDNTIINTNRGIFLHNAFKNTVTNNNIFKARKNGLIFVENSEFNNIIKDNIITGNIFLGTSTQEALIKHNAWGTNTNFGVYNSNYYGHFYYDYPMARSGAGAGNFTLSSWQSNTGQDASSKNIGDYYKVAPYATSSSSTASSTIFVYNDPSDDAIIHYNETKTIKTIDLGGNKYCDVDNNTVEGAITLNPYSSKILLSCFNNNDFVCNNKESHDTAPNDCAVGEYGQYAPTVSSSSSSSTTGGGGGGGGGGSVNGAINTGISASSSISTTTTATSTNVLSFGATNTPSTLTASSASSAEKSTEIDGQLSKNKPFKFFFPQPINFGQRSNDIVAIQNKLKEEGFFPKITDSTGYFGTVTKQSLKEYQKDKGLPITGQADQITLIAMSQKEFVTIDKPIKEMNKSEAQIKIFELIYRMNKVLEKI